ncbi:MAG: hypothetical protein FWG67_08595 [Defluviitaleaceae bacterium]|nr:hypothetical protein [Defluviitaleaceae bacterium]
MLRKQKLFVIFSLFLMLKLFIFFYFQYLIAEQMQMLVSNHLYSTWHVVLNESAASIYDISELLPSGSRLFFEHTQDGNVRTVYQTNNWKPPLTEGQFFDQHTADFQAVVGRNVRDNMNESRYFIIDDLKYDIVGIIGADFPSPLDNLVLLNHVSNTPSLPIIRRVIDTDQPGIVRQIIENFSGFLADGYQEPDLIFNHHIFGQLIRVNVILISFFLIILMTYSYFKLFKRDHYIYYLLGKQKYKIGLRHILILTFLFFSSLFVIKTVDLIVGDQIILNNFFLYFMIWIMICTIYTVIFLINNIAGGISSGNN